MVETKKSPVGEVIAEACSQRTCYQDLTTPQDTKSCLPPSEQIHQAHQRSRRRLQSPMMRLALDSFTTPSHVPQQTVSGTHFRYGTHV